MTLIPSVFTASWILPFINWDLQTRSWKGQVPQIFIYISSLEYEVSEASLKYLQVFYVAQILSSMSPSTIA